MLSRPVEIEIPEDDPFRYDKLGRKQVSDETLTPLVLGLSGPCVLTIDSPWGTGKTTFIKMWKRSLELRGAVCLYFNAWETDFAGDPLIALIGEFESCLSKVQSEAKAKIEKLKKIAIPILKRAIPAVIKVTTAGVVDLEGGLEKELVDFAGKLTEDKVDGYLKSRNSIREFRDRLGELVAATVAQADVESEVSLPMIVFVDELDRCRPTYAIELLERIKHLFDIPGVIFVLGVDRSQIAHSVCAIYGQAFGAEGYLRRFFDIEYNLPRPSAGQFCQYLVQYFAILLEDMALDILTFLCELWRLSLREQTQVLFRIKISLLIVSRNVICSQDNMVNRIISILVPLRESHSALYESIVRGRMGSGDVQMLNDIFAIRPESSSYRSADAAAWAESLLLARAAVFGLDVPQIDRCRERAEQELAQREDRYTQEYDSRHAENVVKYFDMNKKWMLASRDWRSGQGDSFQVAIEAVDLAGAFTSPKP